jgi:hypothetical protein
MPSQTLLVFARQFSNIDDEQIGGSVRAVKIPDAMRQEIYKQNTQQLANWDLFYSDYNHALINEYDPAEKSDDEAEQEIVRAGILLRIIQPYSFGLHIVVNIQGSSENPIYNAQSRAGIGTRSYTCASDANARITPEVVRKAKPMWSNIQTVCQQWEKHQRILGALRFFEIACSNYNGGIRHILFYSGIETLLCTHKDYLGQQIRQRVPALCPTGVSKSDVRDITDMRGGLVHSGAIIEKARGREEELIQKLERILRACLCHVLSDPESVAIFSDIDKLKIAFPVLVKERKWTETGKEISI